MGGDGETSGKGLRADGKLDTGEADNGELSHRDEDIWLAEMAGTDSKQDGELEDEVEGIGEG
jgi:hypothetical protein